MPDNWAYVFAAYGIAAAALIGYWRHLVRRAREAGASRPAPRAPQRPAGGPQHAADRAPRAAGGSQHVADGAPRAAGDPRP